MTEKKAQTDPEPEVEDQTDPQTEDQPSGEGMEATIRRVLGDLLGSGKAKVSDDGESGEDPAAATKRAVAAVRSKQTKDTNVLAETLKTGLAEIKASLPTSSESSPGPIRRVEKFMGWRRDDEG